MSKRLSKNIINCRTLDQNHCFLCGKKLNNKNKTQEHIFPDWLLNKFKLKDKNLILPNSTVIQYKKIKIPCCNICNNQELAGLEKIISEAVINGYKHFIKLHEILIFQWLSKILYELSYLDLRLPRDRSKVNSLKILNKKIFEENLETCHIFLQSLKKKTIFRKPPPWSIFVFNIKKYKNDKDNFDFMDNPSTLSIGIRMGDIGIVACLQDNHAQYIVTKKSVKKIQKVKIHPIQFREIVAKHFYLSTLLNRTPKYAIFLGEKYNEVFTMPIAGLCRLPVFNKWSNLEYAKHLSFYCGIPLKNACTADGRFYWSILWDSKDKNKIKNIPLNSIYLKSY